MYRIQEGIINNNNNNNLYFNLDKYLRHILVIIVNIYRVISIIIYNAVV